ncbi:MAG: DUF4912 domain-containing protein [Candidatus Omnitrophota bacterium]
MQKKKTSLRNRIVEKVKSFKPPARREAPELKTETPKPVVSLVGQSVAPPKTPVGASAKTAAAKAAALSTATTLAPQTTEKKERFLNQLPWNYGDNIIYLMIRDPYWVYSYWEIQKDHQENALRSIGGDWGNVKSILRVYDVTENEHKPTFFDITLQGMTDHWFFNVGANRSYFVEIGLLHRDGRFVVLARSNRVTTPRDGMSEVLDEQWMGVDFDKLYALSGGFEMGKSSLELKKMMQERLQKAISSGSGAVVSSFSSPVKKAAKQRKFWFVLDTELIVYGATEPDAAVTLQGKPIKLRPDGTFSLRFALPDGRLILDATATSADGVEKRKITPVVERNTTTEEPEFLKPF